MSNEKRILAKRFFLDAILCVFIFVFLINGYKLLGWAYDNYETDRIIEDIYGDNVERTLEVLENVPALKSVYDPANFIQVGEPAEKSLAALHSKAAYFHIKDVVEETGELVPAGHGAGKIDELIARIDRDVVMTLEPHLAIFDAYKSIDDTEMKHKFHFASNGEAFDAAVNALKALIVKAGYQETAEGFVK